MSLLRKEIQAMKQVRLCGYKLCPSCGCYCYEDEEECPVCQHQFQAQAQPQRRVQKP